jgi:hypothetical protein
MNLSEVRDYQIILTLLLTAMAEAMDPAHESVSHVT